MLRSGFAWTILLFSSYFEQACGSSIVKTVYEGFDYTSGAVTGKNGGTGWNGSWIYDYPAGGQPSVGTPGLTYPGLTVSGGALNWVAGGNSINGEARNLPIRTSGKIYIQYLSEFSLQTGGQAPSGGGTPNLRFYSSSTLTGAVGANGGTYGTKISILNGSLNAAVGGVSSTSVNFYGLHLVVARIDYDAIKTELWVDPNLANFDYLNPPSANAQFLGLAPQFDKVAIYFRNGKFDEFSLMVVGDSTPSAVPSLSEWTQLQLALIVLAMVGWHFHRERSY